MSTLVYKNFSEVATLLGAHKKNGRHLKPEDLSIIPNGAIVFNEKKILWVGKTEDIPKKFQTIKAKSFKGKVVLPEIVDSHTHLVFGGDRASEYTLRLNGGTYEDIARMGGGILSTMKGTAALNSSELFKLGVERIKRINSFGVGTIEIKSGYGLTFEKELELSLVIDRLKKHFKNKIQIKNTFMAAHAVPKNYSSSKEYMDHVVVPLLEKLAPKKILDAVDIFHEQNYFSDDDVKLLFESAKKFGIPVKMHADEFNDNNGASIASTYNALSADHLLKISDRGINTLAKSTTIATLLPGTGFFLGKPQANARKILDAGVRVAIASDYNPGSCHCDNLLHIAAIAAPTYKMNLAELWCAITLNAAAALGINDQGAIAIGMKPRFSIFKTDSIDRITYNWGKSLAL